MDVSKGESLPSSLGDGDVGESREVLSPSDVERGEDFVITGVKRSCEEEEGTR